MPAIVAPVQAWLARRREAVVDATWLLLALNLPTILLGLSRPSWAVQAALLAAFVAAVPPQVHTLPAPWQRYLRLVIGYVIIAAGGVASMVLWLKSPVHHWFFAPIWLALTFLTRLPVGHAAGVLGAWITSRRLEILVGDLLIILGFSWATPGWSDLPGPPAWALLLICGGWLGLHRLQGSTAFRPWRLLGLAATWGAGWFAGGPGAWPVALIFAGWLAIALLGYRGAVRRWYGGGTGAAENWRWITLTAGTVFWFHPFYRAGVHGTGDASYYATFLADALEQFRAGVFPVLVGQTEYQFNGAVIPIRIAPGFQYAGGLVDLLTGWRLNPMAVQNIVIVVAAFLAALGTYAALRRIAGSPGRAAWLAGLFMLCPGVLGLAFNSDLYMSWLAAPCVPVALVLGLLTFRNPGPGLAAALGLVLGLTWWMHAPIALWLTMVLAAMQALRFALTWRRGRPWLAEIAAGAAAFLIVAAHPLVSAALHPADPSAGVNGGFRVPANHVLQQLLETFPASWLPLSDLGRRLSDFQLGYALAVVGLFAAVAAWRSTKGRARFLVIVAASLLLLLVPIPGATLALWQIVPSTVRSITNVWAMQRLYLLLAGTIVVLAAWAWPADAGRRRLWMIIALFWSGAEAVKFVHGSAATVTPASASPHRLDRENIVLTRYSYGLFAGRPAYFTHGSTDPQLENRLFNDDFTTPLDSNYAAAARIASQAVDHRFVVVEGHIETESPITLLPGRHYLLRLQVSLPSVNGTLVLQGRSLQRVYGLPEYGESLSFGLGGNHNTHLPVHTTRAEPEMVRVLFESNVPADLANLAAQFTLQVTEYDPNQLPIRIVSWIPYRARVSTAAAAWLETPRMHQAGYVATVDGVAADVRKSPEGLVSVRVPAGEHEVSVVYEAPPRLAAAFWLSMAGLVGGALWAGNSLVRGQTAQRQA